MGWVLGIGVYFVLWWVTIFLVLPFGVQSQHETGEVVPGSESGAPVRPLLLKKLLANTLLAAAVWLIIDIVYIHFFLNG